MHRWSAFLLLSATLGTFVLPSVAFAQAQGKGKSKQVEREDERVIFTSHDRDIIRDYFRGGYSNLPPGLAKRGGTLPPGLQKHLERDGTLPPGLQKRLTPFPADLERRLPRLPDIYERGSIGQSVVIIDRRTQKIIDIIHDIIGP